MRVSCPPASTPPYLSLPLSPSSPSPPRTDRHPLPPHAIRQHTSRLADLYHISSSRNQQLLQLTLNLSRDLKFLKEYCQSLQHQLETQGFYGHKDFDRLSRRDTAATIFQSYGDCWELLGGLGDKEEGMQPRPTVDTEPERTQGTDKVLRLHRAVQVALFDEQEMRWERAESEGRIGRLTAQICELRRTNGALELESRRRAAQARVLQGREQVFSKIHEIIGEYKRKVGELAWQKRQIQRKYRCLREKMEISDAGGQLKLLAMLSEKVDILQRLAEKQQTQIQRTIDLYETQLCKIQQRRKEELQYFQNERISLSNENLNLCMDLQRTLNRQDSSNLLLLQERNRAEALRRQLERFRRQAATVEVEQGGYRSSRMRIDSGVVKFYGEGFMNQQKIRQAQGRHSCHSAGYQLHNENSNTSNYEYQYSEMEDSPPLFRGVEVGLPRYGPERSSSKQKPPRERITITYNNTQNVANPTYSRAGDNSQHIGPDFKRGYDSVVQYKRRFVQRKPEGSFKQ